MGVVYISGFFFLSERMIWCFADGGHPPRLRSGGAAHEGRGRMQPGSPAGGQQPLLQDRLEFKLRFLQKHLLWHEYRTKRSSCYEPARLVRGVEGPNVSVSSVWTNR